VFHFAFGGENSIDENTIRREQEESWSSRLKGITTTLLGFLLLRFGNGWENYWRRGRSISRYRLMVVVGCHDIIDGRYWETRTLTIWEDGFES
jgi:hypothetical protein